MIKLHRIPELPLIHFSQKNDSVDRLIDIHELNSKILKTENDHCKTFSIFITN